MSTISPSGISAPVVANVAGGSWTGRDVRAAAGGASPAAWESSPEPQAVSTLPTSATAASIKPLEG